MTVELSTICVHCGTEHELCSAATNSETGEIRQTPHDGDCTICWACGGFNILEHDAPGGLRRPSAREQRALDADPMVRLAIEAWRAVKATRQ